MATGSTDALPRLADALTDVGERLRHISDELRAIHETAAGPVPADAAAARLQQPAAPASPPPGHAPGAFPGQVPADPAAVPAGHAPGFPPGPMPAQYPAGPAGAVPGPLPWPAPGQPPTADPAGAAWPAPPAPPGQVPWYPPPPVLPPRIVGPSLWDRLSADGAGSRLLAWAGGVVTIAGVVLLLVLAIQRGFLGPLPRVILGAGLALALVAVGLRLHRSPAARVGAAALAATGFAGLYLDVIAATTLHGFLPPWAGLVVGLAVAALGIAVAGRWDAQQLAVFVVVCCAVSAPVLTQGFDVLLLGFLLVLTLATAPVHLTRRWPWLALASGLPPVFAEVVRIGQSSPEVTVTAILTTAALVGVATVAALRGDDDQTFVLLLVSPLPAVLGGGMLTDALLPGVATVLLAGVWTFRKHLPRRFALAAGGLASVTTIQTTATALGGDVRTLTLLGIGLVLGGLAVHLRDAAILVPATAFAGIGFLLALDTPTRPEALFGPEDTAPTFGPGGLLITATAVTLGWAAHRLRVATRPLLITAAVITLYGAAAAVLSVGLLISPDRTGFLVGHTLVTVSWTVVALVLLIRGIDRVAARVAGLSLVGAALAKLVLFDLSSLDGMARVAAFLVAGLILLGAGARYARLVAGRTE